MKAFSAFDAYFKTQAELGLAFWSTDTRLKLCYIFFKYSFSNKKKKKKRNPELSEDS